MLTPDQIEALGDKAQRLTDPIVEFLIEDIARRVSEAGQLTSTAAYQVWRLQQLGVSQREMKKKLRKLLKVSHRELRQLLTQSAEVGYNFDISNLPYVQAVPFAKNVAIQDIVSSAVEMAQDDLSNIVQTMGFVGPDGKASPLSQAYEQACDFAFQKVSTGAQDYNSAIRQATKGLAEKGIVSIDYESGAHRSVEAAVRGNVMGALGNMQEKISRQNHDDLGCDGWELSAHAASAPDHEPIQGKQYSDQEYYRLNKSLLRRIGTLNCGHAAYPIILGINQPQYTPEQLEKFREDNEKGVTVDGRHYTMYEATQRQRNIERSARDRKRRILIDEAVGDKERLAIDQTRLVILNDEYARFSKAAGLRMQRERMQVAGFGAKEARAAEKSAKALKIQGNSVAINQNRGIINTRGMSMGLRKPASHILTDDEISEILTDAEALGIERSVLRINEGSRTGFVDFKQVINIRGDILPDADSTIARDKMSARAVLAHEYYGHYLNHPSEYDIGDWRDEFRASYDAAVKAPNLSDEDRAYLMIDAYDRAHEAGEFMEYDEIARRLIYGY